jgi:hypothetical protein
VADEAASVAHHSVHRADRLCLRGQAVEERDHRLLAGIRDVEAGKADHACRLHQDGECFQTFYVDKLVVHAQVMVPAFLLVQRGGERALNARADQAEEHFPHFRSREVSEYAGE